MKRLVLFSALLLFIGCIHSPEGEKGHEGDAVPSFEVSAGALKFRSPDDIRKGPAVLIFIDPDCKDCHEYVSVLNECEGIVVISRSEDEAKVGRFAEETGIMHEVFFKGGNAAYYLMFHSIVPRVLFVRDARIERIYAEPDVPGVVEIQQFLTD